MIQSWRFCAIFHVVLHSFRDECLFSESTPLQKKIAQIFLQQNMGRFSIGSILE